jgi:chromosome segregation ATPase
LREGDVTGTLSCLGCEREYPINSIRVHEESCIKNRNRIDTAHREELIVLSERATKAERERDELQTQSEYREDELADMESQVEDLHTMISSHEFERQIFSHEITTVAQAIRTVLNPLTSINRRLALVTDRVSALYDMVSNARRGHADIHRRRQRGEFLTVVATPAGEADLTSPDDD